MEELKLYTSRGNVCGKHRKTKEEQRDGREIRGGEGERSRRVESGRLGEKVDGKREER